jgi:hypothetical protein
MLWDATHCRFFGAPSSAVPESLPTMKLLRERGPAAVVHRPGLARRPPPAAAGEGLREEKGLVAADLGFPRAVRGGDMGSGERLSDYASPRSVKQI